MDTNALPRSSGILAIVLIFASATASANTIHVPGDQPTIQAGIDAALAGDVVLVAADTYTGPGNTDLDFGGIDIEVRSESGPLVTIIDCQGTPESPARAFHFHGGESNAALVSGFTIQNGNAYEFEGGGAILCAGASPTIEDCVFLENHADDGGAIYSDATAVPIVRDCTFEQNTAEWDGGAVACTDAEFIDCSFVANDAQTLYGDGVDVRGHAILTGCVFTDHALVALRGRGTLTDCTFTQNNAGVVPFGTDMIDCTFSENGNGVLISGPVIGGGPFSVDGCTFTNNGSGITCFVGSDYECHIERSVFAGNDTGINIPEFFMADVFIDHCTLVGNGTGAVLSFVADHEARLDNTIIAFSTTGRGVDPGFEVNPPVLTCCDLFGNAGGDWVGFIADQLGVDGNISEDPLFCDVAAGDYGLQAESPCAPGNSPTGCGLIGALPVGCGATPVETTSWGELKARFR